MFKVGAFIALCAILLLIFTVQEVSCEFSMTSEMMLCLLASVLNGSPAAKTAAANGITSLPNIDTSNVQLPPLPDTSNLFTSISSVSGLTQQIPNLGGSPQSATGRVYQQYVPQAAAPAPVPQAPTLVQAPPADKDDDNDDDDNDDDDDDEDDD